MGEQPRWYEDAAIKARKAVTNQGLQHLAVKMARSTQYAADYIEQAPVLVLAASFGRDHHSFAVENFIVSTFAERCKRRPKLRDLMAEYHVAYPFRALRGVPIAPSKKLVIFALSQRDDFHPSALAQAIPAKPRDQGRWLRAIMSWVDRMTLRNRAFGDGLIWAATASGPIVRRGETELSDIADFYIADPRCFNPKWTYDQAAAATERWHRRLGKEKNEIQFFKRFGLGFSEQIDYGDLPLEMQIGKYRIVALNSGEELFAEGCAMHHCVGSYSADVIQRTSSIFSIRIGDCRVATMEVGGGKTLLKMIKLMQLKGPCNARPPADVIKAAHAFVNFVNDEQNKRNHARGAAA